MPRQPGQISDKVKPHLERIAQLFFQSHANGLDPQNRDLGVSFVPSEAVRAQLQSETGQIYTRTEIENAIKYWRKSGRIQVEILKEDTVVEQNYLSKQIPDLSAYLIDKYSLVDCRLVHGILSSDDGYASQDDTARSRVIRDLGEAGGAFLSESLTRIIRETPSIQGKTKPSVGICVGAGTAVRAAIEQISFRHNFKKALVDITPMTGLLGWRRVGPSPLANSRRLEYVFSGDARLHWYSTPALIPFDLEDPEDYNNARIVRNFLENLPMVKEVDKLRERSVVYIFSVSDAPEVDKWASDQWHLISGKSARQYQQMPHGAQSSAVGAISGLVFDAEGKPVDGLPWLPMGLTLEDLHAAARGTRRAGSLSVLIVGGHPNRIPAVKALLRAGYVNVLITDVYTARDL